MLENPSSTHPDFDETWRGIESLVEEVAQWAKTANSLAEFYGLLIQRTVTELQVAGGAVWILDSKQRPQRIDLIGSPAIEVMTQRSVHVERVLAAFQSTMEREDSGAASLGVPDKSPTSSQWQANSVDADDITSILMPVIVDDQTAALIELVMAAETNADRLENVEHVMAALADVSVDFHRGMQLRDLQQQAASWDAAQEFSDSVHRRLELDETCYAIANEGRRFASVDRMSVLVSRGRSFRVGAISGVDAINRRSSNVILMRRLAKAVATLGEPVWTQDSIERPPQIQQLLDAYHDASGVRGLAVLPIYSDPDLGKPRVLGVVFIEQFKSDAFAADARQRILTCCRHARSALANAIEMNSLPLLWLSRGIRSLAWLLGIQSIGFFALALMMAAVVASGGIAALCLVPVDFTIVARGNLQPVAQQGIFAPADGVVQEILVEHGQAVSSGAVLVRLRNSQLDYEAGRLMGDLATTRAKLQAVQAARLTASRDRQKMDQVNAEIERFKQVLIGLEKQSEILERQRQELSVQSPFAGQVMSWETGKTLSSRPVRQGQRLMTIADVTGPWHLEVDVPDEDIGHVLNARQQVSDPLRVTFILLTDPATQHQGIVADVALATEIKGDREPSVRVSVVVDSAAVESPRPGAGVVARIHCGQRSIGFVWFRGIYEKVRMKMML